MINTQLRPIFDGDQSHMWLRRARRVGFTRLNDSLRVLATGGAGFIGSHLVERLLADGHTVAVLDNFSTGRMKNLNYIKDNPRLSIHRVDVSSYSKIKPFFENVDCVFHLAALADIVPSIQQPLIHASFNPFARFRATF